MSLEDDDLDEEDEDGVDVADVIDGQFNGGEDEIRARQKVNSIATITSLRKQPTSSSRFNNPLCRLIAMPMVHPTMPMVHPTMQSDLVKLEQEFVHGYCEGAVVFYVTTTDEDGKTVNVMEEIRVSWGAI